MSREYHIGKLRSLFEGNTSAQHLLDQLMEFKDERNDPPEKSGQVINIYTDGACRGNPGPGGWGVVLLCGEHRREFCGADRDTTNNRMELQAVIEALRAIKDPSRDIVLYSDSKYVLDGLQKWVAGWKARGWKKADKRAPENVELWKELDASYQRFSNLELVWVKGHSGNEGNERADELANQGIDELLKQGNS